MHLTAHHLQRVHLVIELEFSQASCSNCLLDHFASFSSIRIPSLSVALELHGPTQVCVGLRIRNHWLSGSLIQIRRRLQLILPRRLDPWPSRCVLASYPVCITSSCDSLEVRLVELADGFGGHGFGVGSLPPPSLERRDPRIVGDGARGA